jgi:hypothetical protein
MSNALKEGLVAYYPLQSNAVNMVDGVAGTINGTASWRKNHAGKVVLDDTTASVTHASHDIDTVTYWKDGRFYAVLNGVPYMIDEALSSSFVPYTNATSIGAKQADIAYNMVTGATIPNIGAGGSAYDLTLLNSPTFTTVTYAGRSVNVWQGNGINKALQTANTVPNLAESPFVFSCVAKRNSIHSRTLVPMLYSQRTSVASDASSNYAGLSTAVLNYFMSARDVSGNSYDANNNTAGTDSILFISGLGTDKKLFICIGGVCAFSSTSIPTFLTTMKKLTIGGTSILDALTMFNGSAGEMAWWKNVSGTSSELAAKAVQRNTDYVNGLITENNFMFWRGL